MVSMVFASSARARFPRLASKSCRTRPTVSSALKKSSRDKPVADDLVSPGPALTGPLPKSRYVTYFSLAIAGCAIDLWTKETVFRWRGLPERNETWWLITEHFG